MGFLRTPPSPFPVSFGLRGQHIKQRYSSGFSPTGRHALHFLIIKQASKESHEVSIKAFFIFYYSALMAG
jgi:hypothetical protein